MSIKNEGRDARLANQPFTLCPYPRLTPEWSLWRQGWCDEDYILRTGRREWLGLTTKQ